MALREFASLVTALTASVALHLGAFAALDAARGSAADGRGGSASASRPAFLHVFLSGASPQAPRQPASVAPAAVAGATAPGILRLPIPHYFPAGDLDRKPEAIGEVPLAYPAELPAVTRSRVVLSLLIDEQGRVDQVLVENTDAPGEFEQLASHAFAGARFRPGMRAGEAVKSRLRVEVTFEGE